MPTLKIMKINPDAITPSYATEGASCFDISCTDRGEVGAFQSRVFHTGLAVEVPPGYELKIYSRSGHGFKSDVRLSNCVGVIDSDYRGEIKIKLRNDGPVRFDVQRGDRIAQGRLEPVERVAFEEVEALSVTGRGIGGFGSTGA